MLSFDPFDTLVELQRTLDSFRTSDWLSSGPSGVGVYPPLNVFGKGDDIVLVAEVPGLRKDDLNITVKGRTVSLSGQKAVAFEKGASMHRRERRVGGFSRSVTLPLDIDADRVKAEYREGLLTVHLPRAEHEKPRSIKIA